MEHHPGDRNTVHSQVAIQPNLGLDANNREAIVAQLNVALSDEILLATKTRCLTRYRHELEAVANCLAEVETLNQSEFESLFPAPVANESGPR